MIPQSLRNQIESHEFSARVNVASSDTVFARALAAERAVQDLLRASQGNDEHAKEILARIWKLSSLVVDSKFEHPFDSALAAYLWVLSWTHPQLASVAASAVLEAANCWWARRVAERLAEAQEKQTPYSTGSSPVLSWERASAPSQLGILPSAVTPAGTLNLVVVGPLLHHSIRFFSPTLIYVQSRSRTRLSWLAEAPKYDMRTEEGPAQPAEHQQLAWSSDR